MAGDNLLITSAAVEPSETKEQSLREYLEKYFALSARESAIRQKCLYSIEIELTNKCNLECPYCYSDSTCQQNKSLDASVVRQVLKDGREHGLRSVSWFGGEPLLYPDLFDVLQYAKELDYVESIVYTNGTLLNIESAKRLRGLISGVAVHLDTLSTQAFQAVHFRKSPERAAMLHGNILRSFDNLFSAGFSPEEIRLTLTLCKPVCDGLEELFDWAFNAMDLQTSIFIPLAPFGRGKNLSRDWYPNEDEAKRAYELRAEYEQRPYLLRLGIAEYCKQCQMTSCYITANGNITPYAGSSRILGSLYDGSFNEIVRRGVEKLTYWECVANDRNSIITGQCFNCDHDLYCFGNPVFMESIQIKCPFKRPKRKQSDLLS